MAACLAHGLNISVDFDEAGDFTRILSNTFNYRNFQAKASAFHKDSHIYEVLLYRVQARPALLIDGSCSVPMKESFDNDLALLLLPNLASRS